MENERGYRSPKELFKARRSADWFCVSSHKSAWYQAEDQRVNGKRKDNIHSIYFNFLDLDYDGFLILSEDVIKQRCNAYGLPYPTHIIETSPNHFHLLWRLKKPVIAGNEEVLNYWKGVQKGLYEIFKDLGADHNALDPNRYLRNPYRKEAVNTKYPDKPEIKLIHNETYTSLGELQEAIKPEKPREKKRKRKRTQVSFSRSKNKLMEFFRENPEFQGTYKDISELLQIPERTLFLICKWFEENRVIERFRKRIGSTWNTVIRFLQVDTASYSKSFNNTSSNKKNDYINLFQTKCIKASEEGIPTGYRNDGFFVLTLFLKNLRKWEPDRIFDFFRSGAVKNNFSLSELKRLIHSAFRNDYENSCNLQCEKVVRLFEVI